MGGLQLNKTSKNCVDKYEKLTTIKPQEIKKKKTKQNDDEEAEEARNLPNEFA